MIAPEVTAFALGQKARVEEASLAFRPEFPGHFAGEKLTVETKTINGTPLGTQQIKLDQFLGGGYSAQVFRGEREGKLEVFKFLRPEPGKEWIRDLFYWLAFQGSFAPRLREEAVRVGLLTQNLVREAAKIEFGSGKVLVEPKGYFWDQGRRTFAEIQEYVSGRAALFERDDEIVTRRLKYQTNDRPTEWHRKKEFHRRIVDLCERVGASGVALQYRWHNFFSQPNSLRRLDGESGLEHVAVDWRPGIAFPFFLSMMTPSHFKTALDGLPRGSLSHFDEINFAILDRYYHDHHEQLAPMAADLCQLKADYRAYRDGQLDLWSRPIDKFNPKSLKTYKAAVAGDWQKLGLSSGDSEKKFWRRLAVGAIPVVGSKLLAGLTSRCYQEHLKDLVTRPKYLKAYFEASRRRTLADWAQSGRVALKRAEKLVDEPMLFLGESVTYGLLPKGLHRLATDKLERQKLWQEKILHPIRLTRDPNYRHGWFMEIIRSERKRGVLSADLAKKLEENLYNDKIKQLNMDLVATFLISLSPLVTRPLLAAYGVSSGDFLPLLLAENPIITPEGALRGLYSSARLLGDVVGWAARNTDPKLLLARGVGTLMAPWRVVGNFFAPTEIAFYEDEWALALGDHLAANVVDKVPVYGGDGKYLDHLMFTLFYNLPLSLKRAAVEPWEGFREKKMQRFLLSKVEEATTWQMQMSPDVAGRARAMADGASNRRSLLKWFDEQKS